MAKTRPPKIPEKLYRKFGNWLLDKTIKYGYQTWRAGVA